MNGQIIGLAIEILVAVLLAVTIFYCMALNRRLTRLRADEQSLKATITELVSATQIAERAIAGLKTTVRECDGTLGERLRLAERYIATLDGELKNAEGVVQRVAKIVQAGRNMKADAPATAETSMAAPATASTSAAAATLAAANAFAMRARQRATEAA
jgi:hypothetical protein